jgi:5'-nucleotidase (lipoprotein e(P4) family)
MKIMMKKPQQRGFAGRLRCQTSRWIVLLGLCSGYSFAEAPPAAGALCPAKQYAMALKYQQQSAEIQAQQLQAYQAATMRLQQILKQHPQAKNLAIVTDLDETVLDNSDALVRDVEHCVDYTQWQSWEQWEKQGQPKLIPGSLEFLNYATRHRVKIFYISDRSEQYRAQTMANLRRLALPQVQDQQVLLYGSSKEQRRQKVAQYYRIVLLLGDTLHDFHQDFNNQQTKAQRQTLVKKHHAHFGLDWIVLPNVSYGAWSKDPFSNF